MSAITQIGIVEDDQRVSAMLADAASRCGSVIWQAQTVAEGRARIAAAAPHILLLDVRLPDGDGLELLPVAAQHGDCRSLIVSVLGDEATVLRAIESGAVGYLLKDQSFEQLVAAIQAVIDGGSPITPRLAMFVLNRLRARPAEGDLPEALTERETSILEGLARGLSYAELASEKHLSYHTINTHIKTIYRKLAVSSRNQAVYKALNAGLLKIHDLH